MLRTLPPLTLGGFVTAWEAAWLPILGVLAVGGLYLLGVHRLHAPGRPLAGGPHGVASSGSGSAPSLVATTTALAVYDTTLFWVHMVQHMLLAMVAPVFLALGAPITLALRTLPPAGPRAGCSSCCTAGSRRC